MTDWSADQLAAIESTPDLYVSPYREDGVTYEDAGTEDEAAIDAAYETKYPGSSAVPIMEGAGPKSAAVRIRPR